jgi:hypothetical protein
VAAQAVASRAVLSSTELVIYMYLCRTKEFMKIESKIKLGFPLKTAMTIVAVELTGPYCKRV